MSKLFFAFVFVALSFSAAEAQWGGGFPPGQFVYGKMECVGRLGSAGPRIHPDYQTIGLRLFNFSPQKRDGSRVNATAWNIFFGQNEQLVMAKMRQKFGQEVFYSGPLQVSPNHKDGVHVFRNERNETLINLTILPSTGQEAFTRLRGQFVHSANRTYFVQCRAYSSK